MTRLKEWGKNIYIQAYLGNSHVAGQSGSETEPEPSTAPMERLDFTGRKKNKNLTDLRRPLCEIRATL